MRIVGDFSAGVAALAGLIGAAFWLPWFGLGGCRLVQSVPASYCDGWIEKEPVVLQLDSLSSIDATSVQYLERGDSSWFLICNELNNSIDVYSEATGLLDKRFKFDREGPAGIYQISTCAFESPDSIFVIPKFHIAGTKVVDWTGAVIDERPVEVAGLWEAGYKTVNHMGSVLLKDNALMLSIGPLISLARVDELARFSFEYRYDLAGQVLEELPVVLPSSYQGRRVDLYSLIPDRVIDRRGQMVYSWSDEGEIEVRDLASMKVIARKQAHVEHFGPRKLAQHAGISHHDDPRVYDLEEALNRVLYIRILHDPYRDCYYRIAHIPARRYAREDLTDYWIAFQRNKVGILVLDSQFEIVGSMILDGELYDGYRALAGREGLYLSRANHFRHDFDENRLVFSVFEFVGGPL